MAKNEEIVVRINGDTTGLQKALKGGQKSLDDFGKNTGSGFASGIADGLGKAGFALTSFTGAVRPCCNCRWWSGSTIE
ncbi:hypothetical protein ACUF8D_001326 [Klebsiella aerogenes]